MSELTTIAQGLSLELKSVGELAFNSPRIDRIPEKQLLNGLADLISQTYFRCGQKLEAEDLKFILIDFKRELSAFGYVTLAELEKAFLRGYKEEYGRYYGLSVKTFVTWLQSYDQQQRTEELAKIRALKAKDEDKNRLKTLEMSKEEKNEVAVKNVLLAFDEWQADLNKKLANAKDKEAAKKINGQIPEKYFTAFDTVYDLGLLPSYDSSDKATKYYDTRLTIAYGRCCAKLIDEMNYLRRNKQDDVPRYLDLETEKKELKTTSPQVQKLFKTMVLAEYFRRKDFERDELESLLLC